MIKNITQKHIIIGSFATGCLYLLYLLFASQGTSLHDEIGHFLISRDAIHSPAHIFDIWGRTVHTILYILPAQLGLFGARFLSLLMALLTVYLTLETAKMLQIRLYFIVPFFLWFQPWFADHSYMCITEVPFSLCMILGVYLHLKNRNLSASVIIGLLPLIRHEGIALTGLWCIFLLYKKNRLPVVMAFLPLLIYNLTFFAFMGSLPFAMYFDTTPTDMYGSGSWYYFFIRLPHPRAVGIPIMLLVICGIIPVIREKRLYPVLFWYFSYFALHVIIFRFGLFASGGNKLFLMPVAPAVAFAAVMGLEWITSLIITLLKRHDTVLSRHLNERAIYTAICSICLLWTFFFVKPYPLDSEAAAMKKAVQWIHNENLDKNDIISTHVYLYYFLPKRVPTVTLWEKFGPLQNMAPGTIVIWDVHYSDRWNLNYDHLTDKKNKWKKMNEFGDGTVVIFQKTSS